MTATIHVTGDQRQEVLGFEQILEGSRYPAAGLLPGYPARKQRDPRGERMDLYVGDQVVQEYLMVLAVRVLLCPLIPCASSNNVTTDRPAAASPCASLSCKEICRTLCFRRSALTSVLVSTITP